jgi:periplasmic copper chaperone A
LFALAGVAAASDYTLKDLRIEHPYVRPTPPGARTGAAYFSVRNAGRVADRLIAATSTAARSVELHSMTMDGNLMKMRAVTGIDIPPGGTVTLATAGYHAMLVDLVKPLRVGERVPLTLTFAKAGSIDVVANVETASATDAQPEKAPHVR